MPNSGSADRPLWGTMEANASASGRSSQQTAVALEDLRDGTIRALHPAFARRLEDAVVLRGATGRLPTSEDVAELLDFLTGTLAADDPDIFVDYVLWLASVQTSRGGSIETLRATLLALEQHLIPGLEATADQDRVSQVIGASLQALASAPPETARDDDRTPRDTASDRAHPSAPAFAQCLLAGDVNRARAIARGAWENDGDYTRIATELFQPALYDIGLRWQHNEATVAQEHLATAICQTLLTQLYLTELLFVEPTDRTAVFSAVEGDQHALGLRVVSDTFDLAGWTTQYLGANTPVEDLVAHVDAVRPEFVGLSASMIVHLPVMRRLVLRLKSELGTQCPAVLVGGLATNQMRRAWRWLGADAWSPNAEAAMKEFS